MARQKLTEQILDRISSIVGRMSGRTSPPEVDSSVETRTDKERRRPSEAAGPMIQGAWDWYRDHTQLEMSRQAKYRDYDMMDSEDPILNSALDIYADNATKSDSDDNEVVEIVSEDDTVVEILSEIKDRLNLDTETWSIARALAKYGDDFNEVVVYDDLEVHRLKPLPPETMYVVVDQWGRKPKYPYEQRSLVTGEVLARFEDWQVLHFKLRRSRKSPYGVDGSILAPIRKVYKQLAMMEDAVVLARLTRAQQRYGYLIDVDGIEPGEPTLEYLNAVRDMMKKRRTIDPMTGRMDLRYNPLSMEEDLFIGVRSNSRADVKVLQGSANLGQLQDVEFFQNKLFAGIKVPKAYLGFERDVNAKATLTQQDIQFARSVRRIQIAIIEQYRKLFDFVLMTRGIVPSTVEYSVRLPVISTIDEMMVWQIEKMKAEVASTLRTEVGMSMRWIMSNLLDMSDKDIEDVVSDFEEPESVDNRILTAMNQLTLPGMSPVDQQSERSVSNKQLRLLKYAMREEIDTLKEFIDWKLEHKRGVGLEPQSEWSQGLVD